MFHYTRSFRIRSYLQTCVTACPKHTTQTTPWLSVAPKFYGTVKPLAHAPTTRQGGPSFAGLPTILPIVKVEDKKVHVGWDPLNLSKFHSFWLRDHCRCSQCFHSVTKQRLVDTFEISPHIQPANVEATAEGLRVTWGSPPHISTYPWDWLKRNSYDPPCIEVPVSPTAEKLALWNSKIAQDPPSVEHDNIMMDPDERGMFKLLQKIETFGFCFITGVEATPQATERLTLKIGNIRYTQYGGFWDFTSDLAKGDTAYTTMALQAHTDTTYFTDPCGLQLFHLLSHTDGSGGASLLVDGFYVASRLRELHPLAFDVLTKVRVPTHAAGEPGAFFSSAPGYPILSLGHGANEGEVVQVRYNNDDRSVMNGVESSVLENWYEALRLWNKLLKSKDSEYWVQLSPGTAVGEIDVVNPEVDHLLIGEAFVVVNNHRVLHGRSSFDGKRRMCGAYVGIDDFKSKLTVLSEKFKRHDDGQVRDVWSPLY